MKLFTLIIFILLVQAQAAENSPLCSQKKKQYGKNFISCSEVDWGVKPLSADYQPKNAAPMTAKPSQVKDYKNDYPGIKNTQFYNDQNDLPLASKFISAVSVDPKTATDDPTLVQWLSNDWYNGLQPKTGTLGWEGKCATWSAWSMDPELQKLFSGIRDGILCNGVPFSRGELKEIVTALYPEPSVDSKRLSKFYTGYMGINPDEVEDANVALSKLGVFGQGDLAPSDFLSFAKTTKDSGKNMMMDRDPGSEIWNHPIKKITDVAYVDAKVSVWESLSSAELAPATDRPEQLSFLSNLATVESELTQSLLQGNGVRNSELCDLRKALSQKCDDLDSKLSLSNQVDVLNQLKATAYGKKILKIKQDVSIVKHEMLIEYGTESKFASSAPDQTIVQSYTYQSVTVANKTGGDPTVIRSQWSPRLNRLSDICANQTLAEGRNSTSMTRGFDVKEKCSKGKPVDPVLSDHEYFTGAVPPQALKTFSPKPDFFFNKPEQERAYRKLIDFLGTCEKFDQGVTFLNHLDQAALNNVISPKEAEDLSKEYAAVKNLLDASYIQSQLDNKYQGVQGVATLKSKLKL